MADSHRGTEPNGTASHSESGVFFELCTVNRQRFRELLGRVSSEVTERPRSKVERAAVESAAKTITSEVLRALETPEAGVVTEFPPRPFRGVRKDGNPITFYVRHYRLKVGRGDFYQADLTRKDARLFDALRNALRDRNWRRTLREAQTQLAAEGIPTTLLGKTLSRISTLADLVPPRRHIRQRPAQSRSAPAIAART